MLTYWETLIAARSNITVSDSYAKLWGRKLSNAYTVATYTGTLPATLRTVRGYLVSYKIYGNAVQDGTPTPENPIVPSGCGVRTENLFDGEYPEYAVGPILKYRPIYVGQGTFTLSTTFPQMTDYADLLFLAGNVSRGGSTGDNGVWSERPITVESIDGYVTIAYRRFSASHPNLRDYNTMLNLGSTALPYEPYGYKLPLTVNGVEYPIYLGESQTTRRIKKYEFTGNETFYASSQTSVYYTTQISADCNKSSTFNTGCIVNAYKLRKQLIAANLLDGEFTTDINGYLWFRNYDYATLADFKAYLATQYANGTPVTVWYVLAEPETGIVNEPLMKIGDYADTIDSTQTSVQIPTAAGETTISWAGEGLAPSEVEFVYKVKR